MKKLSFVLILGLVSFIALGCDIANAEIDEGLAVKCLLGEYESGNELELQATAEAMRNRIDSMGLDRALRGVYGCKAVTESSGVFKRGKRVIPDYAVKRAVKAWKESEFTNLVHGADHWEAVETFGKPYWANSMKKTAKVGLHTYFKKPV